MVGSWSDMNQGSRFGKGAEAKAGAFAYNADPPARQPADKRIRRYADTLPPDARSAKASRCCHANCAMTSAARAKPNRPVLSVTS